jgi:hypothetical protein
MESDQKDTKFEELIKIFGEGEACKIYHSMSKIYKEDCKNDLADQYDKSVEKYKELGN